MLGQVVVVVVVVVVVDLNVDFEWEMLIKRVVKMSIGSLNNIVSSMRHHMP